MDEIEETKTQRTEEKQDEESGFQSYFQNENTTLKHPLGSFHMNKGLLSFADYPLEKLNMTLNLKNSQQSTLTEAIFKKRG